MYKQELFEEIDCFAPSDEARKDLEMVFAEYCLEVDDDFLFDAFRLTDSDEAEKILLEIRNEYFQDCGYRYGEPVNLDEVCDEVI